MTRPRKQTVDWFPHSVNHGRTMFVMERRWGIGGYGFWFKLLEVLGNTEGHFIDAENKSTMDYLQANSYTDKETCLAMLDQLADLEAIDPKLWEQKLIWSDNFVSGLAVLYRNRNTTIPVRPDNYRQKSGSSGVSDAEKPARKKREREREEVERKDNAAVGPPDAPVAALFFSCPFFDVDYDYRYKLKREYPALSDTFLKNQLSKMEDWLTDNPRPKRANGHLKNPKLFIRNWLERVIIRQPPTNPHNKAAATTAANIAARAEVLGRCETPGNES